MIISQQKNAKRSEKKDYKNSKKYILMRKIF